jgi:hypothetical protein
MAWCSVKAQGQLYLLFIYLFIYLFIVILLLGYFNDAAEDLAAFHVMTF